MNKYILSLAVAIVFAGCGSSGSTKEDLSVKINVDKTEVAEGEVVTFDSNVTGAEGEVVYTWLENNDTLGTDKNLTKSDFGIGEHTIVLNIENSGKTASDTKTITVSKFLVSLNSSKSKYSKNYGMDENITFEANIIGSQSSTPSYKWLKDGVVVADANRSQFSVNDFNASSHTVLVSVLINAIEKNASMDFNVSDFSELNVTAVSNDDVIIQTTITKRLMWVSDDNKSKKACLAIHAGNQEEITQSETFCQNLNFAGSKDWRKPTIDEVSNFIKTTIDANILPVYYAPCKLLIGTEGGVNQAVITRYGDGKFDSKLAGEVYKTMDASISDGKNIGLRCVRDNN